MFRLEKVTVNS